MGGHDMVKGEGGKSIRWNMMGEHDMVKGEGGK